MLNPFAGGRGGRRSGGRILRGLVVFGYTARIYIIIERIQTTVPFFRLTVPEIAAIANSQAHLH